MFPSEYWLTINIISKVHWFRVPALHLMNAVLCSSGIEWSGTFVGTLVVLLQPLQVSLCLYRRTGETFKFLCVCDLQGRGGSS